MTNTMRNTFAFSSNFRYMFLIKKLFQRLTHPSTRTYAYFGLPLGQNSTREDLVFVFFGFLGFFFGSQMFGDDVPKMTPKIMFLNFIYIYRPAILKKKKKKTTYTPFKCATNFFDAL